MENKIVKETKADLKEMMRDESFCEGKDEKCADDMVHLIYQYDACFDIIEDCRDLSLDEHDILEKYSDEVNPVQLNDRLLAVRAIKFALLRQFHVPIDKFIPDDRSRFKTAKVLQLTVADKIQFIQNATEYIRLLNLEVFNGRWKIRGATAKETIANIDSFKILMVRAGFASLHHAYWFSKDSPLKSREPSLDDHDDSYEKFMRDVYFPDSTVHYFSDGDIKLVRKPEVDHSTKELQELLQGEVVVNPERYPMGYEWVRNLKSGFISAFDWLCFSMAKKSNNIPKSWLDITPNICAYWHMCLAVYSEFDTKMEDRTFFLALLTLVYDLSQFAYKSLDVVNYKPGHLEGLRNAAIKVDYTSPNLLIPLQWDISGNDKKSIYESIYTTIHFIETFEDNIVKANELTNRNDANKDNIVKANELTDRNDANETLVALFDKIVHLPTLVRMFVFVKRFMYESFHTAGCSAVSGNTLCRVDYASQVEFALYKPEYNRTKSGQIVTITSYCSLAKYLQILITVTNGNIQSLGDTDKGKYGRAMLRLLFKSLDVEPPKKLTDMWLISRTFITNLWVCSSQYSDLQFNSLMMWRNLARTVIINERMYREVGTLVLGKGPMFHLPEVKEKQQQPVPTSVVVEEEKPASVTEEKEKPTPLLRTRRPSQAMNVRSTQGFQ